MITKAARSRIESFVRTAKSLLTDFVSVTLQSKYGIWPDGNILPPAELTTKISGELHTANLLRQRITHIKDTLPGVGTEDTNLNKKLTAKAIGQLVAEQAFTLLNRMAAIRMAGERGIIQPAIDNGYDSEGFVQYDAVSGGSSVASTFERYSWYIYSVFDELSIELPGVFNRFSPYGLIWFDEMTLKRFFDLINAEDLSAFYDAATGDTINFWREDETLGWIFQYYNSLEERRKMREESTKPRNSREMAVRNQFFTPDYVVQFLTDNTLGREWWEMTEGKSEAIESYSQYLIHRPDEEYEPRQLKEPTEIKLLDPTCGSMHFGLYAFGVFETIYMDAWDNYPDTLLQKYHYELTREQFRREVPRLILEHNIFGAEIDPRALQIAAVSLWLRAQKSWDEQGVDPSERPMIRKSNLVLAEPMPGNKKLLRQLTADLDTPMKKLVTTVWDKMSIAGEAGLLLKMDKEIDSLVDDVKKNWHKYSVDREMRLELSDDIRRDNEEISREIERVRKLNKEQFFSEVRTMLAQRISELSGKMSEDEGYENSLFSEDAARGLAFIELCMQRFDVIVMNPPFGEGSENSSKYLDDNYPNWCRNLVCAFFDRMQQMLTDNGKLGAIFDRTVLIKSSYESFRKKNLCGFISDCADTGWYVLDASVETSTLIVEKVQSDKKGLFMDILNVDADDKDEQLHALITSVNNKEIVIGVYEVDSNNFINLPNSIIGYYFDENILSIFDFQNLGQRSLSARQGHSFVSPERFFRNHYEISCSDHYSHLYHGGAYNLFYLPYKEVVSWEKNGEIANCSSSVLRNSNYHGKIGCGYGKRGEILDSHILKPNMFFTHEGHAIAGISEFEAITVNSLINSILSQYTINQYCAQHKVNGYVSLLPMPDYESRQEEIERIVNEIIEIKRQWFSLDETNLEYHGLIGQLGITDNLEDAFDQLQEKLTTDYNRYRELVRQNDDLWMDLADIDRDSDFRKTLNDYKSRRPYEELLSIDKGSNQNIIDRKTLAAEILQELVGIVLGRWDMAYASGEAAIPEFGGVFDPLPFMPVVEYKGYNAGVKIEKPKSGGLPQITIAVGSKESGYTPDITGIISGGDRHNNLTDLVREAMRYLWRDRAADIESEIVKLLGVENLREWFESPNGFFDYHLMRYTKSRRKAPIYWPIATADGNPFVWVYYPALNNDTLKKVVLDIDGQIEVCNGQLNKADARNDNVESNRIRLRIDALKSLKAEVQSIITLPYVPNHDDGVPVTAAPLRNLFANRKWKSECDDNWNKLISGEYDWSHLAYSLHPSEIRTKARKDWCLALTHGIEELCENKPKEKKRKTKKSSTGQSIFDFGEDS